MHAAGVWLLSLPDERHPVASRDNDERIRIAVDTTARRIHLSLSPGGKTTVSLDDSEPEVGVLELRGDIDGAPTLIA